MRRLSRLGRLIVASVGLAALTAAAPGFAFGAAAGPDHISITVSVTSTPTTSTFRVTATAKDAANRTLTGYNAAASWSDTSGRLAPGAPQPFVAGVSTTTAQVTVASHRDKITLTSNGTSISSAAFDVLGPLDHFSLTTTAVPSTDTTGTFSVVVNALDSANQRVAYNAPAQWDDLSHTISPAPSPFVDGLSTTNSANVALAYHRDKLTLTSGLLSVSSNAFDVHGPLDHFSLTTSAIPSVDAGTGFTFAATALDAANQVVSGYNGPAGWSDLSRSIGPDPNPFVNGLSTTVGIIGLGYHLDRIRFTSGRVTATTAVFNVLAPPMFTLNVIHAFDNDGSVQEELPSSQIHCGELCTGAYRPGTVVILDAVDAPHWRFVGWTGCTPLRSLDGAPHRCLVVMSSDQTVTAEFAPSGTSTSIVGYTTAFPRIGEPDAVDVQIGSSESVGGTVTVSDDFGDSCVAPVVNNFASCNLTPTATGFTLIYAHYSGDGIHEPSDQDITGAWIVGPAGPTTEICSGTLAPGTYADVVVAAGAGCTITGSTITGNFTSTSAGDTIVIMDSTVGGNVTITGTTPNPQTQNKIIISGTAISGSVTLSDNAPDWGIALGDCHPDAHPNICNTIGGDVTFNFNHPEQGVGRLTLNSIGGSLTVNGNATFLNALVVDGNVVGHNATFTNNAGSPFNLTFGFYAPNSAGGDMLCQGNGQFATSFSNIGATVTGCNDMPPE